MGLVGKLKNILFEEEEVEIPVIEKKEKPKEVVREYKELPPKENFKSSYNDLEPAIKEENKMEEKNRYNQEVSERELFKSEKTFNFPAFDEEEFESVVPKQRSVNVMEYERKRNEKKVEVKSSYYKPERKEEPKKFKPSPIISPVYGILDKNYTPDDITTRQESQSRVLDVDSVRKKAFGEIVSKEEKYVADDKILEEKLEKARTIDELLKDSSDEVIMVDEDLDEEIDKSLEKVEALEEKDEPILEEKNNEEDTLENDLFDLIDSMYENREEEK